VTKKMRAAYQAPSAIIAEAQLEALARELEHTHPGAAGSLREGLAETLTVLRLCATYPGSHPTEHQLHRVDDLDMSQPLEQCEELAER
jgi:putative transposase